VVSVDSSYLAEYGDDAIALYNVDSVWVRGSTIRDNYGYGVYYCSLCYYGTAVASNAVFSRNRFVQNNYGHVYVDNAQTVRFDHNRAVGGGYNGYNIYGDTAVTLVTLLGDSLVTRDYGSWLYLYRFDSLAVDSAVILVRDGYPYINGGRAVSVRDTRFLEVTGDAMNVYPYPQDSTALFLRRVEFRGPDSSACDRCGYGVYGNNLNVNADSVTHGEPLPGVLPQRFAGPAPEQLAAALLVWDRNRLRLGQRGAIQLCAGLLRHQRVRV